jgi:hypothetical protein
MSLKIPRPVDPSLHPLVTGNYRLATPAMEAFYELVTRCLRYRIMGALIYGPPRIGKTRAIEYVRLLLARQYPKITTYHAQREHKPRHAEGPFFANLLEAVGDHAPNAGTSSAKRSRLSLRIREAHSRSITDGGVSRAAAHPIKARVIYRDELSYPEALGRSSMAGSLQRRYERVFIIRVLPAVRGSLCKDIATRHQTERAVISCEPGPSTVRNTTG